MEDKLILVDEQDRETGRAGKMEAHEKGLLHRAFSIFIFRRALLDNPDGTRTFHDQLLIQQRAEGKYHSAGLWANSCCSHPREGENLEEAAARRLPEETGFTVEDLESPLEEKGAFLYKADFDNGLTEHEFDHVFVGQLKGDRLDKAPSPNPEEASQMMFLDVDEIMIDVLKNPGKYAAWFLPALLIATDGEEYGSLNKEASARMIY
ncbi:MAG: isopentenyl-diphosphate Delta-isomerase [Clostridiales bacterium]|nr:isopentenyl-diphosphate Delta-isomerase [Clostridiales bacterium]